MKKSLLTLSTLALFAGAAMADGSFTKIWSVDNQDSYTVAAGDYIRAEGYYYNTTGEQHRGPVYNVGTMTIDGIFESYVDASAQSMLGAQKVLGNGELRINSALFLSPDTDFSGFTGNVDVQRGVLWFVDSKNSPVNVSEFTLSDKSMLKLTNGDFVINGAIKGSGNIHVTLYPDDEIESGVYVIKDATPRTSQSRATSRSLTARSTRTRSRKSGSKQLSTTAFHSIPRSAVRSNSSVRRAMQERPLP